MNQVNLGKIRVMSSPLLIQLKFVQSLGQFCFRKPIEFYVDKPKVNNYIYNRLKCGGIIINNSNSSWRRRGSTNSIVIIRISSHQSPTWWFTLILAKWRWLDRRNCRNWTQPSNQRSTKMENWCHSSLHLLPEMPIDRINWLQRPSGVPSRLVKLCSNGFWLEKRRTSRESVSPSKLAIPSNISVWTFFSLV